MAYRVAIAPPAQRQLQKLPADLRQRLIAAYRALAENPRPTGQTTKLKGEKGVYRIRTGDYRTLYERQVVILAVRRRRDVYR